MRWFAAMCAAALLLPAAADDNEVLQSRYGSDPVSMTIGSGALTVGIDDSGRVCALRWPSPGYYDQLSYDPKNHATGITWGLLRGGSVHWSSTWRWSAVERAQQGRQSIQAFEHPDLNLSGRVEMLIDSETDRLKIHVELAEVRPGDRIVWFCDLTPTTRKLPEIPITDSVLDRLNDLACYVDPKIGGVVHFRPTQPGQSDWRRVEQLARSDDLEQSIRFGSGTWIAYTVSNGEEYRCFDTSVFDQTVLPDASGIVFGSNSASLAIAPLENGVGYLALSFAENSRDLREMVNPPEPSDASPGEPDPALDTLRIHQDASTGSVVRSVSVRPPLNRDWPRYGAWTIRAWDLAGHHDRSRQLIEFYLGQISTGGDLPAGALPFAMYPDGSAAALRSLVDTEAAGWVLWAVAEHINTLDAAARAEFLDLHWQKLATMTGFVVNWAEDTSGIPRHAYDPVLGRDRRDRSQLFTGHLALTTMIALAQSEQREVPESWTRRKRQWDALLESYSRAPDFQFTSNEPLPFWVRELFPLDHQAVQTALRQRRQALDRELPGVACRRLAEVALYLAPHPAAQAELRENLRESAFDPKTLAATALYTDSYVAATAFIAEYGL